MKMKRFLSIIILSIITLFTLTSCITSDRTNEAKEYEIPSNSINYIKFSFGNVIYEGKRAVFFEFASDYPVSKMEYSGSLLDANGNILFTFEETTNFSSPSKNPEAYVRVDQALANKVRSVTFSKIKAYTTEKIIPNN